MSNLCFFLVCIISIIDKSKCKLTNIKFRRIEYILVSSISCYKCSSVNGSNPSCEDLFQGDIAGTPSLLQTPCFTNLRGRKGRFPATHCIKLIAYSGGKLILIRLRFNKLSNSTRFNTIYLSNM